MFLYVTNVFKCFLIVGILRQLCMFDLCSFIISFDFSSSSHCSSKPRNETVRYADGLTWKVTIYLTSERLELWQKVKCLLYYTYPIYVHIIFLYVQFFYIIYFNKIYSNIWKPNIARKLGKQIWQILFSLCVREKEREILESIILRILRYR